MVWGGAVLDVIARLRRERPDLASRRSSVRPHELGYAGSHEAFPCLYLCDACGYLADARAPCPACDQTAWIDLNLWAHAHALREREEAERQNPSQEVRWQVRLASLALGGGLGVGVKDFRAVYVFEKRHIMERFIEQGLNVGAQADAAAKSGGQGEAVGGELLLDGIRVYQLTESGLALQATIQGTKYWKDPELN